jgi:hypothetical protein
MKRSTRFWLVELAGFLPLVVLAALFLLMMFAIGGE